MELPSTTQEPVSSKTHTSFYLGVLLGVVLGVGITAASSLYLFSAYKANTDALLKENAQASKAAPEFTTYTNKELGIAFEYPESWGEINVEKGVEDCFSTDANYYTSAQLQQMKKDVAEAHDPCLTIFVKAGDGTFLVTMTPLAVKYPIPRGGFWGFYAGSVKNDAFVENYCSGVTEGTCEVLTNAHNIRLAHYSGGSIGLEEQGEFYLAHTPHSLYYGLALSPSRLPVAMQDDFSAVIDSLRFIQ